MLLVVGGHARKIGKSSVVEGLIRALPEGRWTAVKITQHTHGGASFEPGGIRRETPGRGGDSGRYLAAGAKSSFLVQAGAEGLAGAMPALRGLLASCGNVIVESNSFLEFAEPDLFLFVLDFSAGEFKESGRRFAARAGAFVLLNDGAPPPPWKTQAAEWLAGKPCFRAIPPEYVTDELAEFVRERLRCAGQPAGSIV